MPRQNRVTPFGEIVAIPERGTFMGNRGLLHNAAGNIKRAWNVKRWLVCVLEFRGRKRAVMTPNSYTELFFLDEATALAAGHRPCAECRHARFLEFCTAWKRVHPRDGGSKRPTADEIDNRLHAERVAPDRSKRSYTGSLDELPDGVFVVIAAWGEQAYLVWGAHLLAWSPGGYRELRPRPKTAEVLILTPPSTVGAIRAGYCPEIHPCVGDACGATHEIAASKAGVSKRTVERRMKEPAFLARLQERYTDMAKRSTRTLTAASGEAVKTLVALLQPTIPHATRLGAARSILEIGMKARENTEFEERLAALEQQTTLNNA